MRSVVIVGGGVIGCASALALARRGFRTIILERGTERVEAPGATGAASWAAAGIVGAQVATRKRSPLSALVVASRALYPAFAATIRELTGLDVEFRPCGLVRPARTAEELASFEVEAAWHEAAGLRVERLDAAALRAREPALSAAVCGGLLFPDEARIDPPALLASLRAAVERAGARFSSGAQGDVRRVIVRGGRACGLELASGEAVEADAMVIAAGSWSSLVEGAALPVDSVQPARGEMVELRTEQPILRGVVEGAGTYLSPRDDGRVLIGSTMELAGYKKGASAGAVRDLLTRAFLLVPELAHATMTRAWAGFRPYVRDELPVLGASSVEGLFVATGHYRNGILLAPITAEIVAALVAGEPPPVDLAPFSPLRIA
jgi:glycine oxidase